MTKILDSGYIEGTPFADSIYGAAGDDTLNGVGGGDFMYGNTGNDLYYVENTKDKILEKAGSGYDSVISSITYKLDKNVEKITLSNNMDVNATGNDLDNVLIGNLGNNVLDGGLGADTMTGGLGDDTYCIDNLNDTIIETPGEGSESIIAYIDYTLLDDFVNLTLSGKALSGSGNSGDNIITGQKYANTLYGNDGNDTIDGGKCADTMYGGVGNDTYYVDNLLDVVAENLNQGADTVYSSVNYSLSENVENLILSGAKNINATGNSSNNVLCGNSGKNIIDGGLGADGMYGYLGNDTYYVDNAGDFVTEAESEGIDTVISKLTTYTLANYVENLTIDNSIINQNFYATGNIFNNTITGGNGNDTIDGATGVDKMLGGKGNDTYYVDETWDVVTEKSNQGIDNVFSSDTFTLKSNVENLTLTGTANISATGNTLANIITGNYGNNTLAGGSNNDTYLINQDGAIDIISDSSGKSDLLSFGADILKEDIVLFASGKDIIIDYEDGNQVTIKNQLKGASAIEKIQLSDNSYITNTVVNTLIQQMATYAKANGIQITSAQDVRDNQYLNDLVLNSWQGA